MTQQDFLGQPAKLDLRDMLAYFPRLHRAEVYKKIKKDPTIKGFVMYKSLAIGERGGQAMLPFGPNCETLKDWREAAGKPIQTGDHAYTNPCWPVHYAFLTESFPLAEIDELIRLETEAGMAELPKLWVNNPFAQGIKQNDRLFNPELGASMLILTFGSHGGSGGIDFRRMLVCPLHLYQTTIETDETSPDHGYPKGHQHWEWITLSDAADREYYIVADHHGMPFATLVYTKREATKE